MAETEIILFDGTHADAWRGYRQESLPAGWIVEEGMLVRRAPAGDIITREQFADFELELAWRVDPGGNSGVIYRVSEEAEETYMTGPEYQILDNARHPDGRVPETSAAALYGLYPPMESAPNPAGEWNLAKIVVCGNHVEHWLNDKKVVECEMHSEDFSRRVADSKFRDWERFAQNRRGHIALQDHGDLVWYRHIRLRPWEASS